MMSYIGCDDKIRELALGKVEALLLYKKKMYRKHKFILFHKYHLSLHDFRLLPRCKRDLRSSEMLQLQIDG